MPYINGELKSSYTDSDLAHLISCLKWFIKCHCPEEFTEMHQTSMCNHDNCKLSPCHTSCWECSIWIVLTKLEAMRKEGAK